MFCHSCGNTLPQGHRFCQKCGADNQNGPQQTPPPPPYRQAPPPPPYRQAPPPPPYRPQPAYRPTQTPYQPASRPAGAEHSFVTDLKRSKVILIFGIVLLVWWHFIRTLLYQAIDYSDYDAYYAATMIIGAFNALIYGSYVASVAYSAFKRGFLFTLLNLVPVPISYFIWFVRYQSVYDFVGFFIEIALLFGMIGIFTVIKRQARKEFSKVITCVIVSSAAVIYDILYELILSLTLNYLFTLQDLLISVITTAFAGAIASAILCAVYERRKPAPYPNNGPGYYR